MVGLAGQLTSVEVVDAGGAVVIDGDDFLHTIKVLQPRVDPSPGIAGTGQHIDAVGRDADLLLGVGAAAHGMPVAVGLQDVGPQLYGLAVADGGQCAAYAVAVGIVLCSIDGAVGHLHVGGIERCGRCGAPALVGDHLDEIGLQGLYLRLGRYLLEDERRLVAVVECMDAGVGGLVDVVGQAQYIAFDDFNLYYNISTLELMTEHQIEVVDSISA